MSAKLYAVIDEYEGGFVGTMEQIVDWLIDRGCTHGQQKFYTIGEEVVPMFGMED